MVSLAELSHVASVASVVTCCLLMLGFLLRLCGQDLLQGVGLNDDRQHNFITKIFASQKQNVTNVRPIDLFVGVTKVRIYLYYQLLRYVIISDLLTIICYTYN